ncbi:MAG: hypothetical protein FJW23_02395 [Acidimicrobiia bacterium]|nr:hypothetical protein [Acidimicrobiia bacterium]
MDRTTKTPFTPLRRMGGALMLKGSIYEEIEHDRSATVEALAVVLLGSMAAGVGGSGAVADGVERLTFFATLALAAWFAWAVLVYQIGTRILPGARTRTDMGELLRTLGYGSAPAVFLCIGAWSPVRSPVFAIVTVWLLVATVVAIGHALDYARVTRAVAVAVLAWGLTAALAILMGVLFGPTVS